METSSPIFGFNDARAEIVREVTERVATQTRATRSSPSTTPPTTRSSASKGSRKRPADRAEHAEWQRLARSPGKLERRRAARQKLEDLRAQTYAWDVAGNFNPRVYKVSTKILPPLVTAMLQPRKLARLIKDPAQLLGLNVLEDKVAVQGPSEKLQRLARSGTMVYVPTHLSNMDSIVFGYALMRAGLPPATYGAGKNLFTNPILSFFMHNLGAYRVDRRIKHALYKKVLTTYSTVLLESAATTRLFFPGGTRSRIRRRRAAPEARPRRERDGGLRADADRRARAPRLLRAEHDQLLDHPRGRDADRRLPLRGGQGPLHHRGRRIDAPPRAASPSFVKKLLEMNGSVVIRLGQPRDLFGNLVDDDGDLSRAARPRRRPRELS